MTTANKGDCDCCGKYRKLTFSVFQGMDTYACSECRGGDDDGDFFVAFKGATAWEMQVGRLWIRIPFWNYIRIGSRPTVGWERNES